MPAPRKGKRAVTITSDSSAIVIPINSATKPTATPTTAQLEQHWSVAPHDGGDKYRAAMALRHFKPNAAQFQFMLTLIDRANPETGRCDPGTNTLIKDTGAAKRSIERARAFWRKKEVIAYFQR